MSPLFYVLFLFQSAAARGSIEGIVMNSGTVLQQALPNARLELREGPQTPIVARSDPGGRFVFANLAPGRYRLFLTDDGFIRQEYGQRGPNQPGTPISIVAGQAVRDIVFRLESSPTITGWVQDPFGQPIANILVQALKRSYNARGKPTLSVFASALTDDRGQYRVFWIDPGEYFASAMSNPVVAANAEQTSKAAFTPTYFPGVTDPDSAKSFRVDIGREVRADFRLVQQEAARVFGFAFNATNGRPVAATIGLAPVEDVNVNQYNGTSTAGSFAIDRVVPGSYIVSARSTSGERLAAFTRIRVLSAKQFFLDLRLPMSPGLQIVGNLGLGSEVIPDISRARISLTTVETGFPSPLEVAPNARGQFSFSDVLPGEYLLSVSGLPDDMYVRAAIYDTTDALESGVTVRNQISSPLQLQLGADGGRIAVAVFNRDNKQLPDVSVVLVPDSARRHRPDQYRIAVTGSEGQATFRGIPPGNYKIFAWEQLEPNAYLNSEFIHAYEDLGVGVTIKPAENAAVGVRVIPRDE